jgi:hypothetical protein
MTNDALMTRARRVNPVPPDTFGDLAGSADANETLEMILEAAPRARAVSGQPAKGAPRTSRRRTPVRVRRLAITVTVAALELTFVNLQSGDRPVPAEGRAWAPRLVALAERSPRLLLDQSEWRVTRADEFDGDSGEMTFENGRDCNVAPAKPGCYWVSLDWRPADTHEKYLEDRRRGADASSTLTIAGHEATVFELHDTALGTTYQAMWLDDEHSLELRSDLVPSLEEFAAIAGTLHDVDTDTWLTAMPANVVTPDDRAAAVDEILDRLPVPKSLDAETLKQKQATRDGYALEYEVKTAVVCGWVQQWVDGTRSGDEAAKRRATEVMARAGDWLGRYGGKSYVDDVAEAMATGSPVNGDTSLPTGTGYQRHLGCPET